MKENRSAPIRLLDITWGSTNDSTAHSWERLNHAMHSALKLAIGAGFKFEPDDFTSYRREPAEHGHCPTCKHVTTWSKEILDRRFKITPADIKADRAERKERAELRKRLSAAEESVRLQALAELKVKTQAEFDALPVEKIREVAARLLPPVEKKKRVKKIDCPDCCLTHPHKHCENCLGTVDDGALACPSYFPTKTRTDAQVLSGHSAVIWVEGIAGCYLLDRVRPAAIGEAQ